MNMNTAQQDEQNDRRIVEKAKESLDHAMQKECEARKALAMATETTKIVRSKYEHAWQIAEAKAVAHRKSGLIEITAGY